MALFFYLLVIIIIIIIRVNIRRQYHHHISIVGVKKCFEKVAHTFFLIAVLNILSLNKIIIIIFVDGVCSN